MVQGRDLSLRSDVGSQTSIGPKPNCQATMAAGEALSGRVLMVDCLHAAWAQAAQTDGTMRYHCQLLSTPGFEPGLSRPQRDVLTTRRCGPQIHCNRCEHQHYLTPGSFPAQSHELQATHAVSWRQSAPPSAKTCHSSTGTRARLPGVGHAPLATWQLANRAPSADQL